MLLTAFIGGFMIGLSAAILLICYGDILGFSGIVSSIVLSPFSSLQDSQQHWKLVFLASFIATSHFVIGPRYEQDHHHIIEQENNHQSCLRYVVAGLLVGFGTLLGNGCTSGHGICGMSRFSPRSIVAVLTFMSSAIITTTIVMPNMRIQQDSVRKDEHDAPRNESSLSSWLPSLLVTVSLGAVLISTIVYKTPFMDNDSTARAKAIPALVTGILMSIGLYVSEMIYPSNIMNFLNISLIQDGTWDASLLCVMASGILVSFLSYQIVHGYKVVSLGFNNKTIGHPILLGRRSKFNIPTNKTIDAHLVLGAMLFGIGWSLGGLCPAPAMVVAAIGHNANVNHVIQYWWPAYIVGAYVAREIKTQKAQQLATQVQVQKVA